VAGCNDGGCSCRIVGGSGITVTGAGTLSSPYVVANDAPGLSESFQVNDTETVNLTLRGLGTPEDPFILQADSSLKLTQLSDVHDPEGGPAVGEVPTWVGVGSAGHWEFKTPPPAPAGAVNVSYGLAGVGSAPDPIHVRVLSAGVAGPLTGLEVYVDTAGNLRAVPPSATAVDWSTITGKPSTFPPSPHTHTASQITDPQNFTGASSVGNALHIMGHQIFTGAAAPVGMVQDDLWFKKA
jgi:hypothetical protein